MENWKWIKGLEGRYQVSDNGRVKSFIGKEKILKNQKTPKGYLRVTLNGKVYPVHRLVADTFIPNPKSLPVVNHKDLNRKNNHVSNLEWVTQGENIKHRHDERWRLLQEKLGIL